MGFDIKGLGNLQDNIQNIGQVAQKLTSEVNFDELFPPEFMSKHTSFATIIDLLKKGGFTAKSSEDLKAIPSGEIDPFISKVTKFSTLAEMLTTAAKELAARKLGS